MVDEPAATWDHARYSPDAIVIALGQNYQSFMADTLDWTSIAATYIGIPLFLAIWLGYRWKNGTRLLKYEEIDLDTDRDSSPALHGPRPVSTELGKALT